MVNVAALVSDDAARVVENWPCVNSARVRSSVVYLLVERIDALD